MGCPIVRAIPEDFCKEEPPGAERARSKSGTPEIFEVNTMLPRDRAEIGRPEGVRIMERDSRMST